MTEIQELLNKLKKAYGDNSVKMGNEVRPIERIPLVDSPAFDYVSDGGVVVNRINQFIGLEQCTKTLHALLTVKEFQHTHWNSDGSFITRAFKKNIKTKEPILSDKLKSLGVPLNTKTCVWIDAENTFNEKHAKSLGIDLSNLVVIKPSSLVEGIDVTKAFLVSPEVCLVVYDSMQGIGHEVEIEESHEKDQISINARAWNKAMRAFQGCVNRNPNNCVSLVLINSMYEKSGFVMGDPITPSNGSGVRFKSYLTMHFKRMSKPVKEKVDGLEVPIGNHINMINLKNKSGETGRSYSSLFYYSGERAGKFDIPLTIIELATDMGFIVRSGAIYTVNGVKFKGMSNLVEAMEKDEKFINELKSMIYEKLS